MQFLVTELDFVTSAIRILMAWLCQLIYPLISWLYNLFMNVTKVNILSTEQIKPIYQRVTMLLTIVMVFYVTFQFVKFVVQPDGITDKEKGVSSIVYKMIMVVVLIAFVPKIFEGAMWAQNKIIDNDLVGKVILGRTNNDIANLGANFSATMFSLFYGFEADPDNDIAIDEQCEDAECRAIANFNLGGLAEEGSLANLTMSLNDAKEITSKVDGAKTKVPLIRFDYNGLLAVIVGCVMVWMLSMYCLQVGVRWAQLVFLQIIAPIPIIGYLSPKKDGIFQKWTQQCLTTYLDLFLRIAIIYIVLLISHVLTEGFSSGTLFSNLTGISATMKTFVYIVLVLGVLMFAQKAPKMLSELFPKGNAASGDFGLKPSDGLVKTVKPIGRVAGAAAGAAIGAGAGLATGIGQGLRKRHSAQSTGGKVAAGAFGATWGAIRGAVGGAARGVYNGGKKGNVLKNSVAGAQNQIKSNKRFGNKAENGYSVMDQVGDAMRHAFGAKSRVESLEDQKVPVKKQQEVYEKVRKANDDMRTEAEKQVEKGKGRYSGELAAAKKNLQNMQDNQNFRSETRMKVERSEKYQEKVREIESRRAGLSGTPEQIQAQIDEMKATALEEMTTQKVGEELAAAQQAVKKATDKAVNDFITNGEYKGIDPETGEARYSANAKLESIRSNLTTELTEYNRYNAQRQVDATMITAAMNDGEQFDALIKGQEVEGVLRNAQGEVIIGADGQPMTADFSHSGINDSIDENQQEITRITAEQEDVKRQISGSGIGEDKK